MLTHQITCNHCKADITRISEGRSCRYVITEERRDDVRYPVPVDVPMHFCNWSCMLGWWKKIEAIHKEAVEAERKRYLQIMKDYSVDLMVEMIEKGISS
jgi:hypothetical protein